MFSKKSVSPEVVDQFNKSLTRIKEKGTFDKIFELQFASVGARPLCLPGIVSN